MFSILSFQNEIDLVKLLLNFDFDPTKESKKRHQPKKQTLSLWATNVWEQKSNPLFICLDFYFPSMSLYVFVFILVLPIYTYVC